MSPDQAITLKFTVSTYGHPGSDPLMIDQPDSPRLVDSHGELFRIAILQARRDSGQLFDVMKTVHDRECKATDAGLRLSPNIYGNAAYFMSAGIAGDRGIVGVRR